MLLFWKALNGRRGINVQSPYSMNFQLLQKLSKAKGHIFLLKPTIYKRGKDCIQIPMQHRLSDGTLAVCYRTISQPLLLRKLFFDQIRFSDKASTPKEWKQEPLESEIYIFCSFSFIEPWVVFNLSKHYGSSNASTEYFRLLKTQAS